MIRTKLFLLALLALPTYGPRLSAQATLGVNPKILVAGESAEVVVSDPSLAGQTVTVEIDNGSVTDPRSDSVEVKLDAQGEGTADWPVPDDPNWVAANFTAPHGSSVSRLIVGSPDPQPIGGGAAHHPSLAARRE